MTEEKVVLPEGKVPTLRLMTMPRDTNPYNIIFGGFVLAEMDKAAGVEASNCCGGRAVTAAMNEITFDQPVYVGDVVNVFAEVVRVGTTSMTIQVDVYAQRSGKPEQVVKVTSGTFIFVAVDENGKKRPVKQ